MTPFLLVLSSPSGGGKSTIAHRLLKERGDLGYSVSATTRQPRTTEKDGQDYFFVTREEFQRRVKAGEFVEWAEFSGELYGTLKAEVERVLQAGRNVVLDIEIEGARQVKRQYPESVSVFILPPSGTVLLQRLTRRNTESSDRIQARVTRAIEELAEAKAYDYVVVNDDLFSAVAEVGTIIDGESLRTGRSDDLGGLVTRLQDEVKEAGKAVAVRSGK